MKIAMLTRFGADGRQQPLPPAAVHPQLRAGGPYGRGASHAGRRLSAGAVRVGAPQPLAGGARLSPPLRPAARAGRNTTSCSAIRSSFPIFLRPPSGWPPAAARGWWWTTTTRRTASTASIPVLRQRIPELMAQAEAVVVGNRHLESFAARHSRNVHVIPTVVDVARYTAKQDYSAAEGVRLVWIGTPVTAEFLKPLAPVLAELKLRYPGLGLRLIGAGEAIRQWLPFAEVVAWSEVERSAPAGRMRYRADAAARQRVHPRQVRTEAHPVHGRRAARGGLAGGGQLRDRRRGQGRLSCRQSAASGSRRWSN